MSREHYGRAEAIVRGFAWPAIVLGAVGLISMGADAVTGHEQVSAHPASTGAFEREYGYNYSSAVSREQKFAEGSAALEALGIIGLIDRRRKRHQTEFTFSPDPGPGQPKDAEGVVISLHTNRPPSEGEYPGVDQRAA